MTADVDHAPRLFLNFSIYKPTALYGVVGLISFPSRALFHFAFSLFFLHPPLKTSFQVSQLFGRDVKYLDESSGDSGAEQNCTKNWNPNNRLN